MGPFDVAHFTFANERYDSLTFVKDVGGPPVKGGLVVNASDLGILSGLDRMRLFQVGEVNPRSRAILPLAAQLPTNGGSCRIGTAVRLYAGLVFQRDC